MYLDFFGFKEHPFLLTADPRFLYLSKTHARAVASLEYALMMQDSFLVITGEVGTGKTTLIKDMLSRLDEDHLVANLYHTRLNGEQFLQAMAMEFGLEGAGTDKVGLIHALKGFLIRQHAQGRRPVLIVDEAQNLSPEVLEEVRLISLNEVGNEKVLNVILVGQDELNATLDSPGMEQLVQRMRLRFHIAPLDEEQILAYIGHRLKVAGGTSGVLFHESMTPFLHRYTGGVPRLINVLCDMALVGAYAENTTEVSQAHLESAVQQLGWVPYADRPSRHTREVPQRAEPSRSAWAKLLLTRDNEWIGEYYLDGVEITIGRSNDNKIRIHDIRVSRHHARILMNETGVWLQDQDSRNGTYVNTQPIDSRRLKNGDNIGIGKYQLKFVMFRESDRPRPEADGDKTRCTDTMVHIERRRATHKG
jgi:type II secretory pathway predicted ATPase ExeA